MKRHFMAACVLAGLLGHTLWGSEAFDVEGGVALSTPFQSALSKLSPDDQEKLRALSPQENTTFEDIVGVETQDAAGRLLGALLALEFDKRKLVLANPAVYGPLLKAAPHWIQGLAPETLEAARMKYLAKSGASPRLLQSFYGDLSWHYLISDSQRKLVIGLCGFVMVMILHGLMV